ncbi:MAG: hypothetical protein LBR59_00750 [Endomicrobium sp.]|jgi:hypothetical protein|nr:hypothetical protein [Endomicrobium sp.]
MLIKTIRIKDFSRKSERLIGYKKKTEIKNLPKIVISLDVSKSMLVQDLKLIDLKILKI